MSLTSLRTSSEGGGDRGIASLAPIVGRGRDSKLYTAVRGGEVEKFFLTYLARPRRLYFARSSSLTIATLLYATPHNSAGRRAGFRGQLAPRVSRLG